MLFKTGNNSDNPFGVSPLRNVYLAWKYISAIEELEAINIQKDLSGVPLLTLPAQYMSSEATPEQKAIYEEFKRMGRNIQSGAQSCIVLPSSVDPDTRQKLFNVELLSLDGKRGFATKESIIILNDIQESLKTCCSIITENQNYKDYYKDYINILENQYEDIMFSKIFGLDYSVMMEAINDQNQRRIS
jgi:hypothetical protein